MRVKLRTLMSGPKGSHQPGSIVDLDQAEAYNLIERGFAEHVEDMPIVRGKSAASAAVESAVLPLGETTEAPANRRSGRS